MRTITSNGGNLGRLAVLAVFTAGLASYLGVTVAGAAHPPLERAPATTISSPALVATTAAIGTGMLPPGWVEAPNGVQSGFTDACYANVCYLVDQQGEPYGQPLPFYGLLRYNGIH